MERGTPFALAHRFFQSGPFRPGNVHDRAPGSSSPARARCPASACRWCCCRAGWPPTGSSAAVTMTDDARDLDAAYSMCRALHRRHGTTYFWAAHVLPARQRRHVHALYAYCR